MRPWKHTTKRIAEKSTGYATTEISEAPPAAGVSETTWSEFTLVWKLSTEPRHPAFFLSTLGREHSEAPSLEQVDALGIGRIVFQGSDQFHLV